MDNENEEKNPPKEDIENTDLKKPVEKTPPPEKKEEPAAVPINNDSFNSMADNLSGAKPEKQPHFVQTVKENREKKEREKIMGESQDFRFLKDKSGRYWNGEYCSNNVDLKTGEPEKMASGLWKLKRGIKSADRKKLSKRPPNIDAKMEKAQEQEDAEQAAALVQQNAIMSTQAILAGHRAIMSQVSGEKAVSDVMNYEIGEGQFKVKVSQLLEASGVEMMVKRGGGPQLSPEVIFIGGLTATTGMIYFKKEERRETVKEKMGLFFHRMKNKKKSTRANNDEKVEGLQS